MDEDLKETGENRMGNCDKIAKVDSKPIATERYIINAENGVREIAEIRNSIEHLLSELVRCVY